VPVEQGGVLEQGGVRGWPACKGGASLLATQACLRARRPEFFASVLFFSSFLRAPSSFRSPPPPPLPPPTPLPPPLRLVPLASSSRVSPPTTARLPLGRFMSPLPTHSFFFPHSSAPPRPHFSFPPPAAFTPTPPAHTPPTPPHMRGGQEISGPPQRLLGGAPRSGEGRREQAAGGAPRSGEGRREQAASLSVNSLKSGEGLREKAASCVFFSLKDPRRDLFRPTPPCCRPDLQLEEYTSISKKRPRSKNTISFAQPRSAAV